MTTEIERGIYPCKRGGGRVVVGITDKESIDSMQQVYLTASSTRDACNQYRTSVCPEDCELKDLINRVVDNLNELLK